MRDELSTIAAGVYRPLRKCEWCNEAAQRQADLCLDCERQWAIELEVPYDAGCQAECVFGLHRAMGVFW